MSCIGTWHQWRCDGCGLERRLPHGPWAEAAIPDGWRETLGWGRHACSQGCLDTVQAKQITESGKLFIWCDPREAA